MNAQIFTELSIAFALTGGVALVMRLLRQPLIIGYILTGIVVGPTFLNIIHNHEAFESFSQIGIALLLFIVGLGLNVTVIRSTGKPVLISFLVVTTGLSLAGIGLSHLLGFSAREAIVAAAALCFSSTIIVIKALSDKKEQTRLYGQVAIGILLVEDILATVALLALTATTGGSTTSNDFIYLATKGIALAAILTLASMHILPRLGRLFAASQEFLFIFSLAWAFGVASAFAAAGFSIEVGALFAGVSLASLPYAQEMSNRLKPLRDFFIVLFFIGLGEQLQLSNIKSALLPALVFSGIIIFIKPLLLQTSMGLLGYTKQTGFKMAIHLTQLSEFSIILAVLAHTSKFTDGRLTDIMTLTAIITIAISTYLMKYDDEIYRFLARPLQIFERANATLARDNVSEEPYQLVLFGYHKGGHEFVKTFREMNKRYVVVDYNPDVIDTMEHQHIHHIYGDATDAELLEELNLSHAELVVSTIGDFTANKMLGQYLAKSAPQASFVCHANDYDQAAALYEHGANYVILPHFIGSQHLSEFIKQHGTKKAAFSSYRKEHLIALGNVATVE